MDKVLLIKDNLLERLGENVKIYIENKFSSGDRVVVKAHMGEYGNLAYVRPPIIGVIIEELKKVGAKPILLDTTVAYHGSRYTPEDYLETARKNGFTKETVGCPIKISDDFVSVKGEIIDTIEVAKEIAEADGMVVVSHFKGHGAGGFGGGIKNLGMGAVSKKTKWNIHELSQPKIVGECKGCGVCVETCPFGGVKLVNEKAEIDPKNCWGCGQCVVACPNNVLKQNTTVPALLSEVAKHVLDTFDKNKLLFVNVLFDINAICDCAVNTGFPVVQDIGILVSDNILAIDKASLELVNKEAGKDIFKEKNKIDSDGQIKAGIKLGLGDGKYELMNT